MLGSDADAAAPSRQSAIADALRRRILGGVHLGTLGPDDRLGSVRDVAAQLRVDPRVVHAAYRQLAAEGLVSLRPRSGVFVATTAGQAEPFLPQTAAGVVDLFMLARSRGLAPTELRRQARLCLDSVRVRAACIECNQDQIHALCSELRHDYGIEATGVECDEALRPGSPARALERVDFLVTTRFHDVELKRRAARLRKPLVVISLEPEFMDQIRRVVAEEPLYFLCVDPRFAAKLPRIFAGLEAAIRPVVLGRDALDLIPTDALVYAMASAREHLPARPRSLPRLVTAPGMFSAASARALLTAIVRRNLQAAGGAGGQRPGRSRRAGSRPWAHSRTS
jgi:DNA-binding transcriptional regulator YhcF (GntR family)